MTAATHILAWDQLEYGKGESQFAGNWGLNNVVILAVLLPNAISLIYESRINYEKLWICYL